MVLLTRSNFYCRTQTIKITSTMLVPYTGCCWMKIAAYELNCELWRMLVCYRQQTTHHNVLPIVDLHGLIITIEGEREREKRGDASSQRTPTNTFAVKAKSENISIKWFFFRIVFARHLSIKIQIWSQYHSGPACAVSAHIAHRTSTHACSCNPICVYFINVLRLPIPVRVYLQHRYMGKEGNGFSRA